MVFPSFFLEPQPARAATFVVIGNTKVCEGRHPAPGIEQNTEDRLVPNVLYKSRLIESKNVTISASSKTGVCEDSRTSLGGLARAARLYSTTPRIISESNSNRTAAK